MQQTMTRQYFKSFNVLTDKEIEELILIMSIRKIEKLDFLVREGEVCKEVGFLVSGIFRSYYVSEHGEEITYCIIFPNNLLTAYSSFITGNATQENIQAISSAELMVIPKQEIVQRAHKSPNWLVFMKIMAEQQYIELERRVFQLQRDNAAQRYATLLKEQPEYLQKIPLQYLASYLGITQRHLSRIRKETAF